MNDNTEALPPSSWRIDPSNGVFVVYRLSHWNTGWREYLTARDGVSSRPSRFRTESAAMAAILRAEKGRQ